MPPQNYYARAMAHYAKLVARQAQTKGGRAKQLVFVVASESQQGHDWFDQNVVQHKRLDHHHGAGVAKQNRTLHLDLEPVETMAVLAQCDGSIMSFGTYGWWGAWLSNGPVTYSNHLNEGNDPKCGVAYKSGGVRDLYPPEWVPI